MALQEPIPGQPLTATWGRDVVREIRRLRPTPGPGMRMSYGPNGTTFAVVAKGVVAETTSTEKEPYPFRLGVGTEMDTDGDEATAKFHKVAVMPAVDIDGTGYFVLNNAVPYDSQLGGLPLPKAGSGLPWVWIKDGGLEDIEDEAADRTTTDVYLHLDKTNAVCVLANTGTIPDTEVTLDDGTQQGRTITFHSDDAVIIGKFDLPATEQGAYDPERKPRVVGQYAVGAIVTNGIGHRSEPGSVLGIFEGDNTGEEKFAPDFNYPGATGFFNQTYLNYGGPTGSWKPHVHLTGDDPQQSPVGWERGKTAWKNGHNVNDPTDLNPETGRPYPPVGASVKVLSHVIRRTVGTDTKTEFFFTRLDFDETGLLVRAVPCTDWFVDPT